jgi:hypothetical protein
MLEVSVRLHNANAERHEPSSEIIRARIYNNGTGDDVLGDYFCAVRGDRIGTRTFVIGEHRRDAGVSELLRRVFDVVANR